MKRSNRLQLRAPLRREITLGGGLLCAAVLIGGGRVAQAQTVAVPVVLSADAQRAPSTPSVPAVTLSLPTLFVTALKTQVATAIARGRTPLLELSTPWCVPCHAFDTTLSDARMREALRGTVLIRLNVDEWEDAFLASQQMMTDSAIFALVPLDSSGQPVGRALTTQAWRAAQPAIMAPIVQLFVSAHRMPFTPATPVVPPQSASAPSERAAAVPVAALTKTMIFSTALRVEVSKAVALGRVPIMVLSESGCGACQQFEQDLRTGDPQALAAFKNTYVIHIDGSEWGQVFDELGFVPNNAYPTFFALDGQGRPVRRHTGYPETAEEWRAFNQALMGSALPSGTRLTAP